MKVWVAVNKARKPVEGTQASTRERAAQLLSKLMEKSTGIRQYFSWWAKEYGYRLKKMEMKQGKLFEVITEEDVFL